MATMTERQRFDAVVEQIEQSGARFKLYCAVACEKGRVFREITFQSRCGVQTMYNEPIASACDHLMLLYGVRLEKVPEQDS